MSHSGTHTACSISDWPLALSDTHCRFLCVFSQCTTRFFSAVTSTPLSAYTTVYWCSHLLKNILVASTFCYLWNCYKHPCACFCVNIKFQFIWGNIKKCDCWVPWCVQFSQEPLHCLPKWLHHLQSHQQWWAFLLLHILSSIWWCRCSGFWPL